MNRSLFGSSSRFSVICAALILPLGIVVLGDELLEAARERAVLALDVRRDLEPLLERRVAGAQLLAPLERGLQIETSVPRSCTSRWM